MVYVPCIICLAGVTIITFMTRSYPSSIRTVITHEIFRHPQDDVEKNLQFLHGNNVRGLNVVLVLLNFLLQLVCGHFIVLDDQINLQLLDTKTNSDKFRSTPSQTVLLDCNDVGLQLLEIGLVVCGWLVATEYVHDTNTYPKA
jgi:hypothetical protein